MFLAFQKSSHERELRTNQRENIAGETLAATPPSRFPPSIQLLSVVYFWVSTAQGIDSVGCSSFPHVRQVQKWW